MRKSIPAREPTNVGYRYMCAGWISTLPEGSIIQLIQLLSYHLKTDNNYTDNYDHNKTDNDNLSIKIPIRYFLQTWKTM